MPGPPCGDIERAVGARLRSLREAAGLSLREAEDLTGVKGVTTGTHERGEHGPGLATLAAYARSYGVRLGDLLDPPETPELVTAAFTAITGAARSGATEQIRQQLLDEADDPRWDDASVRVIVRMAEMVGGPS